ncbi:MAG TPA: OsmC family protein [Actinomycetota bacterium]|nr:OsmC family protein [Actinomycetota bacterium]
MARIIVRNLEGDRYTIGIRDHEVVVDQPVHDGGTDAGPTPTELFVGGLASCVAFYAGRFLERHAIEREGLSVTCDWEMADERPNRVGRIEIRLALPAGFPADDHARLMAVVEHCTVHNSMVRMPEVHITAEAAPAAA